FRQKLDATYQLKIDSTSNLKIMVDGTLKRTKSNDKNISLSTRGNNLKQNDADRTQSNDGSNQSFFASVFYNKKLKKTGRTFTVTVSQTVNQGEDNGFLLSKINYYDTNGIVDRDTTVDQLKTNASTSSAFNSNITYT